MVPIVVNRGAASPPDAGAVRPSPPPAGGGRRWPLLVASFSALLFLFGSVPLAFSITLDDFAGDQEVVSRAGGRVDALLATPSCVGGVRTVTAASSPDRAAVLAVRGVVAGGSYYHSQDASAVGVSELTYDGAGPTALAPAGLGGIDLLEDGATRFVVRVTSSDRASRAAARLRITVFDAGDPTGARASATSASVGVVADTTPVELPFSDLAAVGGAPADLRNVGAVVLSFEGPGPGADLSAEWFGTDGSCAAVPGPSRRAVDVCGVCGGDGTSCLDCAGVPFGPARVDRCGACGGDGRSCLGCTETENGAPPASMADGARKQQELAARVLSALGRASRDPATRAFVRTSRSRAAALGERNFSLAVRLPRSVVTCANTIFCVSGSNAPIVSRYRSGSEGLRRLTAEAAARLARARGTGASVFVRQAEALHTANLKASEGVAERQSYCS